MNPPLPREAAIRAAQRFCLTPPPDVAEPPPPPKPKPKPDQSKKHKSIARVIHDSEWGKLPCAVIAHKLKKHNATISEQLNAMLALGLVAYTVRLPDKFANATRIWRLTEKGKALL
jgi:hypothetical protein